MVMVRFFPSPYMCRLSGSDKFIIGASGTISKVAVVILSDESQFVCLRVALITP